MYVNVSKKLLADVPVSHIIILTTKNYWATLDGRENLSIFYLLTCHNYYLINKVLHGVHIN